jgi:hypothetical protein
MTLLLLICRKMKARKWFPNKDGVQETPQGGGQEVPVAVEEVAVQDMPLIVVDEVQDMPQIAVQEVQEMPLIAVQEVRVSSH